MPSGSSYSSFITAKDARDTFFRSLGPCYFYCSKDFYFPSALLSKRKPLEVGLKLVITLRNLATGETYSHYGITDYSWLAELPYVNCSVKGLLSHP